MIKAYSYIRMSTDIQLKGDSLRRQLESSYQYAKNHNLELVDSIQGTKLQDLGISAFRGKNTSQGTLSIFLDCIKQGLIEPNSVLLVESLDRLSRNKIGEALTQFLNIVNSGIEIITLTDNQKYNKDSINQNPGALYVSLGIMFRANEESETKSKRLKSAWSNKREKAILEKKPMTKTTPSWLTLKQDKSSYIVNAEKSKVVKEIFDLCANSTGVFGITRYLNESQIPTFNGSKYWHMSYVTKILSNRAVIGEYQPHHYVDGKRTPLGESIKNYFPLILTEEEFNLAHAAINLRRKNTGRKGSSFSNILSGIVFCSCGSKMYLQNKGKHTGDKRLICYKRTANAGCNEDSWVFEEVLELLFKHLKEVNFDELLSGDNSNEKNLRNSIATLEVTNDKLNKQLANIVDMTTNDALNDISKNLFIRKMNDITAQIENNNKSIEIKSIELENIVSSKHALNHENVIKILDSLKTNEDYMFRASVNNLLTKAIEKIELHSSEEYHPWDLDEESAEVKEYRKTHAKLKLEQILERDTFMKLFKKLNRKMIVKFRFGAVRTIQGDGISYYAKKLF